MGIARRKRKTNRQCKQGRKALYRLGRFLAW